MKITMPPGDRATLERLLAIAAGDTGQSRTVADVLLAWWNAQSCGGLDVTALWSLDTAIARDCLLLIAWVAQNRAYPDELGYSTQFAELVNVWRPQLSKRKRT